jgi:hypothetical protein
MMKEKSTRTLERKLVQLRDQMFSLFPIMRGSVVEIGNKNKQPHFSLNKSNKTNLLYLGKSRESAAKKCSANYKKMMLLVDEMTLINMELLKRRVDPTEIDYENS